MNPVYHPGEIEVQRQAGVRQMALRVAHGIHNSLIAGAAHFLAEQPMVIVGYTDGEGLELGILVIDLKTRPQLRKKNHEKT